MHLIERAQREERAEAWQIDDLAVEGHTGGHTDLIGLGDAGVDEAVRIFFLELADLAACADANQVSCPPVMTDAQIDDLAVGDTGDTDLIGLGGDDDFLRSPIALRCARRARPANLTYISRAECALMRFRCSRSSSPSNTIRSAIMPAFLSERFNALEHRALHVLVRNHENVTAGRARDTGDQCRCP